MVRDNQSGENDNLNKVIHNIEIELVKMYDQRAKGDYYDTVLNIYQLLYLLTVYNHIPVLQNY
jgi:hypothetical protein